ncbi:double-stranded RNA-specific editase 1-like isoform X2 [Chelonus insularis]|uniref:double-stranded RNA-specific editase 1-like isoform X2 n=1 Tax=Chelonus insularis TaxID=460826 RepID=UPI00158E4955|nr:double-stranded RNA-specific editase 1-like isoform X2 [Chelonus insularis]
MFTRSRGGSQSYGAGRGSNNPGYPMGTNAGNYQSKPSEIPMNQQQNMNQQMQPAQNKQPINEQTGAQIQNKTMSSGPNQGQQQQPQTPRLKPILKQSTPNNNQPTSTPPQSSPVTAPTPTAPVTPVAPVASTDNTAPVVADSNVQDSNETKDVEMTTISETDGQPRWKRLKIPGVKVNRKLKRLRMNQRLRKTLMPKNAIMVLNEMKAGVRFNLIENQSLPNSMFLVHAELDGKTYVGQGLSKPLARQNAAENALKGLLLEKMNAASKKMIKMEEDSDTNSQNNSMNNDEDGESTNIPIQTPMETNAEPDETDEIPWSSLASFALYKLFLEWQNQGTVVPMPRSGIQQAAKSKAETRVVSEKKLPPNPWTVHPVMLLNQMRPGSTYVEVSRRGNPPNTVFTLSVEIDGQAYCGEAKNKKDAKKMAAKNALKAVFNVDYPEDNQTEMNTSQIQT